MILLNKNGQGKPVLESVHLQSVSPIKNSVRFWARSRTERAERKIVKPCHTETLSAQTQDKQLCGIVLEAVLEKRRLDQALNAKEFAVCAGVSYSTARNWFHLPGFPAFRGVIFWQDFAQWRTKQNEFTARAEVPRPASGLAGASGLPARAARILLEA